MKKIADPKNLPLFTLSAGIVGLLLRLWLFTSGIDSKNLLITSHPANALVFILTAIVIVVLFLGVRPLSAVGRYRQLFPASSLGAGGCLAAAVGILVTNIRAVLSLQDTITVIVLVLGILASASLVALAVCRQKGKQPHFLLHTAVTVYLMLHLVAQYRHWSPEPQLQTYFFQLLACVFLMLTAYHSTVLDVQKGSRRWFVFFNQAALYCCLLSIAGENWLFYLTMAVWTFTGICSLQVKKASPAEPEEA